MCTKPNTTATNPDNFNEKDAVFKEINTWARHIGNSVWLITSFFIALNFMAIKIVFSDLDKCYIKSHFESLCCWERLFLVFVVFATLWLIPTLCVLRVMAISNKLSSLLKKAPDSLQIKKMHDKLGEHADYKKVLKEIIKFPYSWITIAFTILFLLAWIWIFFYFIP